jgi:hypothetical protein
MATLLQSAHGGTYSLTGSLVGPTTVTASLVGFPAPTTAGSLIIVDAWFRAGSPAAFQFVGNTSMTSGLAATGENTRDMANYASGEIGEVDVAYFVGASSLATTVAAVVEIAIPTAGTATATVMEYALYEFGNAGGLIKFQAQASNSILTPTTAPITLAGSALVFSTFFAPIATNVAAAANYTLGVNATLATVGQFQYDLLASAGTITTAFGGPVANSAWACIAMAFSTSAAAAANLAYSFPTMIF